MRSCAYCGKELADGELCNCPQAVMRRSGNKQQNGNNQQNTQTAQGGTQQNTWNNNGNSYRTGYTKKENKVKHAWEKHRAKAKARVKTNNTGIWQDMVSCFTRALKSPVDAMINPRIMNNAAIIILSAIQGAIIWLCMYFLRTGIVRSPFGIMLSIITINPYKANSILWILTAIASGALGGILFFLIYTGVFCLIDRFVFRQSGSFWNMAQRLISAPIPFTLICVIGCVFGLISSTSLAIMIICGIIAMIALTYEALKAQWISFSSTKIIYSMMLGFFIIVSIICYIVRIA